MPAYENGPTTPYNSNAAGAIPEDLHPYAINFYPNRTPVLARFPEVPVNSTEILLFNDDYRPRKMPTTASIADTTATTLTVADTSSFEVGDVFRIESEYVMVTAITAATTATITRGHGGSTAASHASGKIAELITNGRTGAEVNQVGISRVPQKVVQYSQTVQHPYSTGGSLQAKTNFMGGAMTPLGRDVMMAIQHTADDFEVALYSGKGAAQAAVTGRPTMKGFTELIATNHVDGPTDAGAYTVDSLIRDLISPITAAGGNPGVILASSTFQGGFSTWGNQLQRLDAGQTQFGVRINLFFASFLAGGVSVIYCPLLTEGTAICLTAEEVQVGIARHMINKPKGSRGDAFEGDVIMEGALLLGNEKHHSIVTGVTGFVSPTAVNVTVNVPEGT